MSVPICIQVNEDESAAETEAETERAQDGTSYQYYYDDNGECEEEDAKEDAPQVDMPTIEEMRESEQLEGMGHLDDESGEGGQAPTQSSGGVQKSQGDYEYDLQDASVNQDDYYPDIEDFANYDDDQLSAPRAHSAQ